MDRIILDTETISLLEELEGDIMFQLSFLKDSDGKIEIFDDYMKPEQYQKMTPTVMSVLYKTPEFIENFPPKEETMAYKTLQGVDLDKSLIIAHNAPFDLEVLSRANLDMSGVNVIDTLKVTKFLNDQLGLPFQMTKLQYMKYHFRLDKKRKAYEERLGMNIEDDAHNSISDIVDLWIYYDFIKEEYGATDEQMVNLCENPLMLKHVPFGKNKGELFEGLTYNQLSYYSTHPDEDVSFTAKKILGEV